VIILSHPTGNQFVRSILIELNNQKVLSKFHTSIAVYPDTFLEELSKIKLLGEIKRREFHPDLKEFTSMHFFKEFGRLFLSKFGINFLNQHEVGFFSIDAVYRHIDRKASKDVSAKKNIKAVYAYEDAAFASFSKAKKENILCIYDLPIAYWETLRSFLAFEAERLPEWAVTLHGGIKDSAQKLERKCKELEMADMVVIPSSFVQESLPSWAANKQIIVSPFGSPFYLNESVETNNSKTSQNKPLRVLFVGSMGQRKGLADLFEATKLLPKGSVELVVMGSLQTTMSFYKSQHVDFIYEPGRPHHEVLTLMKSCDVFCLPSIVEGRALVMQEAMSQGLPVIITPNTGGADLIIEGETGFLVPIRRPDVIAEKINWFVENRSQIPQMGERAKQHAMQYTWDNYRKTIVNSIIQQIKS
jgi:glycosyltransferase involved in cell wall biosynthesis